MSVQERKYYAKVRSPWMRLLVGHPLGALSVHWVFQGMLYMDRTERLFKLGLDLLLALPLAALASVWLPGRSAAIAALLGAHTLNFLFNGQVFGVLKHFGAVRHTRQDFEGEVEQLRAKVAREPRILYAAAYGSLARGEWKPTSDLDVRLVRAPGLGSGLHVCWFATRERWRAFLRGFPLDIYVLDRRSSLAKMREVDGAVVLGGIRTADQAGGVYR